MDRVAHTYFDPMPSMAWQSCEQLIELWKRAWHDIGWRTVVLGPEHVSIEAHERLSAMHADCPAVEPREYALACFLRWDAIANVGGGWFVEYDVFPGHCGRYWHPRYSVPDYSLDRLVIWQDPVTCVMSGSSEVYRACVDAFVSYERTGEELFYENWYDMHVARGLSWQHVDVVRTWSRPGWQEAPMVHFCNQVMRVENAFSPRHEFIPGLLWGEGLS